MRRILCFMILGILLLAIQSTFLTLNPIWRIRPDLLMILNLYLAFFLPPISGGALSFFLGLLTDLFSGNSYGLFTFSRPIIFCLVQFLKESFYLEEILYKIFITFFMIIFEGLIILFLLYIFSIGSFRAFNPLFFKILLPQALTTAIIMPYVFPIFNLINRFISGKPSSIMSRGF